MRERECVIEADMGQNCWRAERTSMCTMCLNPLALATLCHYGQPAVGSDDLPEGPTVYWRFLWISETKDQTNLKQQTGDGWCAERSMLG